MNDTSILGTGNIRKLVWRMAIPSMLAQFVSVLYSIVDRIYIGHIADGANALAGVGLCGPIVTLISGFGVLVGVGGAPLLSIKLGEKNPEGAKKVLSNCFVMLIIISVFTMALALLLKGNLLKWFGATPTTISYADTYLTIYLLGTIFALISVGLNLFIVAQGYAKIGMASVVAGAIINLVLDPLFIYVFKMGVAGAALATVIAQGVSVLLVLLFLFSKKVPIRITFGNYSFKLIRRILKVGFSPFIIIATDSIMLICLNSVLSRYGGADANKLITCATIMQSFLLLVSMPLGGITSGTQTILGYNYGARSASRVLNAEKHIVILCLIFTSVMFILAQTLSRYFVMLFTSDPEYIELSIKAIRIFTLGIIPLSIQYTVVDGFTGIGHTNIAILLSLFRKTLFIVLVFALPPFFGAESVFFSEPICDFAASIVSGIAFAFLMKKILKKRESQKVDFL